MVTTQTLTESYRLEDFPEKRLFIIEGPAGCGKSTLVQQLSQQNPSAYFPIVQSSLKSRYFKDSTPVVFMSAGNDYNKLILAMKHLMVHQAAVIDRCIASQWVYHQIRLGTPLDGLLSPPNIDTFTQHHLRTIVRDLMYRGAKPYLVNLDFHFIFLLPPIELLVTMRSNGRKEYPNDAIQELFFYNTLAKALGRDCPGQHLVLSNPETYFAELVGWKIPEKRSFLQKEIQGEL